MAFHVYNTKQQALNAQKLAELFSFISNDFAGLVSTEQTPIIFGENSWSWNISLAPTINFIGGGINVDFDFPEDSNVYTFTGTNNLYGIDIVVPSDSSSISTDIYNFARIDSVHCEDIKIENLYTVISNPSGSPSINGYYEYVENIETHTGEYILSEDTQVDTSKVYYYEIENSLFTIEGVEFHSLSDGVSVLNSQSFSYYGNTIWIDKSAGRFFIPICGKDKNDNLISLIFNRDKVGYESFLSARTYYSLLKELSNKFVFRAGGKTLGDIGQLNVTDNNITNRNGGTINIESAYLNNIPVISDSAMEERFENNTEIDRYTGLLMVGSDITDTNNNVAKEGRIQRISDNYKIPIRHGGTSSSDKDSARKKLDIFYDSRTPVSGATSKSDEYTYNPKKVNGDPDYGALWFKIIK